MKITNGRLKEIAERSSPSLRWGEAEQIATELLANREARPVGFTSAAALDLLSHGQAALIHRDAETTTFIEEEYRDVVPLFTYAPAVASGENCWSCGKFFTYAQHSECDGYCPHCNAPVDLDEEELDDAELLANREAQPVMPAIPDISSIVVNDAAWKLHDSLTEHGPLNGRQFNNIKGCLYEALKIVMIAPQEPAAPDAVDIFADQVIGTKTKIIRMPAPLNVPQEGIRVYLNADELFMHLEKQGYIVEVSNE